MKKNTNNSRRKANRLGKNSIPRIAMGSGKVFGFPREMLTKLRYVDTYSLVSAVGVVAKQVLYINSTFDPDNTGTGHQPLYRDTYAGIYDQYAVVAARATVTFINSGANLEYCGVFIDDDNSINVTPNTLMEQSTGQSRMLPPLTGSLSSHTFTVNWNCKQHLGIDPFASETYKTPVGSNPAEVSSLILWAADAAAGTTTYAVHVELEQTVLWTELQTPTGS